MKSIGVLVPTLNGANELRECLEPVLKSSLRPKVLVLDSASTDETEAIAKDLGVEFHAIARSEFNHGTARELGRKMLGTDIVVMFSQDVRPTSSDFLEKLVRPILKGTAVVSYGRQLPHEGAGLFESFPREFNYPAESHTRTLTDAPQWGVFTFFCSDSCSAYDNKALDAVGGFPPILTNEDYVVVAKLLKAGGAIAYQGEAEVRHSHAYTLKEEFQRNWDNGYMRSHHVWVNRLVQAAEKRGAALAKVLLTRVARERPLAIPYAVLQCAAKWIGFRLGRYSFRSPLWWKLLCSGQKYYFRSKYYQDEQAAGVVIDPFAGISSPTNQESPHKAHPPS